MLQPGYYGAMMLYKEDAEALISGLGRSYPSTIRPVLQIIGPKDEVNVVSGLYIIIIKRKVYFFADTTVNIEPDSEQLAEIAISAADIVSEFDIKPKIAMLSFSNFGSVRHTESVKVKKAVEIVNKLRPDLIIDGEMQADTALVPDILAKEFPFSRIQGGANLLVFPNLSAGNIAYKLLERLTDATVIGPILLGMKKAVNILQRDTTVNDIVNVSAITVVEAMHKGN
jgi:malate dehydrogenase (oxaloacetate-decarboxylating)(NADP+)